MHYNLPTVNPIYLNNILKPSKQSQNTQCQNRNCSGDETQLNGKIQIILFFILYNSQQYENGISLSDSITGANSNSCGNQFRNKNAIYNKKHVEFPNDIKYCHDEQLSTALPDGGHGKNGDHLSSFDTFPGILFPKTKKRFFPNYSALNHFFSLFKFSECNEDIISWQEHNLDSN